MRFSLAALMMTILCGGRFAAGQELKAWRVTNPADTTAVGPVDAGPLEAGTGPSSFYVRSRSTTGPVEAGLYLEASARASASAVGGVVKIEIVTGAGVVHYTAPGNAGTPLVIVAGNNWVRLEPGSLIRVEKNGDAARFLLGKGHARRFAGAPPAEAPAAAQGGEDLVVDAAVNDQARIMISRLNAANAGGHALDWISRAERGDLAPTERFTRPSMNTYVVRTTGVVTPRAANVSTPPQLAATPAVATGFTQAQALLASQNPASVVVGARLERTRIVGNPGTPTGSEIRFNTQARPPLQLGTTLP